MKLFEYYAKWKMSTILTWMNNFANKEYDSKLCPWCYVITISGGIEAGFAGTVWIPIDDKHRLTVHDPKPDYVIKHVTELSRILEHGPGAPELEDSSSNASDGL